jgi:uncharacterized RDD family membrane protein YckC
LPAPPSSAAATGTLPPAGFARRLASMLYESLLLLGVLSLTFLVPYVVIGYAWGVSVHGAIEWLHLFLVTGAYFVWFWRKAGQTLAMQTWRVRLDGTNGGRVTLRQALLRYALCWPSVLGLFGLLWALVDRDRQFLHDRLAGTRLVLVPPAKR